MPNALPQRTQCAGSSSLIVTVPLLCAAKSMRGTSSMTFSGQVLLQRPHWMHALSSKRSIGLSGLSLSAPVGQAETQARHSVQPATFTSSVPNGAPFGSASASTGAGAASCSFDSASRARLRLSPSGRNARAFAAASGSGP